MEKNKKIQSIVRMYAETVRGNQRLELECLQSEHVPCGISSLQQGGEKQASLGQRSNRGLTAQVGSKCHERPFRQTSVCLIQREVREP